MELLFVPETDGERVKAISGYNNKHKDLTPWVNNEDGKAHPCRTLIQDSILNARIISRRQIGTAAGAAKTGSSPVPCEAGRARQVIRASAMSNMKLF